MPRTIELRSARLTRILGHAVPDADVPRYLPPLGFHVSGGASGTWRVVVPTWRVDVSREIDLIEEVGRHHGFDRLPATFPALAGPHLEVHALHRQQLGLLALQHLRHRDAGPLGDDLRDLLGGDLLGQQRALALERGQLLLLGGEVLLELHQLAVADLSGPLEVRLALGALELDLESLAPLLQRAHPGDRALLVVPARLHGRALVA